MSTEEARMIARRWNALVDRGIDPAEEQKLRDRLEQLKTRCTTSLRSPPEGRRRRR